jgi:hypothetical protein
LLLTVAGYMPCLRPPERVRSLSAWFSAPAKEVLWLARPVFRTASANIGRQFEKLRRGFHVRQFLCKFKVRLSVGLCELDHLSIVFLRATNGPRVSISHQVTRCRRSSTHVFKCLLGLRCGLFSCLTEYLCNVPGNAGGILSPVYWENSYSLFLRALFRGPPNERPSARIG